MHSAPPSLLRGAVAAPQTGLTSCQIGDMGHPGTVHGNPRHIPNSSDGEFTEESDDEGGTVLVPRRSREQQERVSPKVI